MSQELFIDTSDMGAQKTIKDCRLALESSGRKSLKPKSSVLGDQVLALCSTVPARFEGDIDVSDVSTAKSAVFWIALVICSVERKC